MPTLPTRVSPFLMLAVMATACESPTDLGDYLLTETVGTVFVLGEASEGVSFTVTNITDEATYYIDACGHRVSALVDRLEDGDWEQFYGAICLANLSAVPLVLGPHQRIESSVSVGHPGVYRLRLGVKGNMAQQFDWIETSNSFVVQ